MFSTLANVFRIAELRNKILFTLGLLIVYRIGFYVPIPGVNGDALGASMASKGGGLGVLANYLSVFSGGSLGRSTIFGLGIMPYISASIILQLLATVLPSLEKLKKEGEPGMRKINEWTRYLTVVICVLQGGWWIWTLLNGRTGDNNGTPWVYPLVREEHAMMFLIMGIAVLSAGSLFLMWLGEQIDHYGIGNGVSLIITAGIVCRMPDAILMLYAKTSFSMGGHDAQHPFGIGTIVFLILAFVVIVAGSILLTQAQRRIRIQQAKHMRGRKVYGGGSQYLPLRVNHAGVMPIIFASSLMVVPSYVLTTIKSNWPNNPVLNFLDNNLGSGGYGKFPYEMLYIGMIFFFSYFWNTVQFNPKEIANQLRDYGSFIPGLRPGKRTADYLENVMMRITYVGSAFLALIAVIPTIIATQLLGGDAVAFNVTQFLGGTGLLIVISVVLDLINRIEANLVMRDYGGFLEGGGGGGGKVKRPRGGPVRGSPQPSAYSAGSPKGLPT